MSALRTIRISDTTENVSEILSLMARDSEIIETLFLERDIDERLMNQLSTMLQSNTTLRNLSFYCHTVQCSTEPLLKSLSMNKTLKRIRFTEVGCPDICRILQYSNIEEFIVTNCFGGYFTPQIMLNNTTLKTLYIGDYVNVELGFTEFVEGIVNNPHCALQKFITYDELYEEHLPDLIKLINHTKLVKLHLYNIRFQDEGMISALQTIEVNNTIKDLFIRLDTDTDTDRDTNGGWTDTDSSNVVMKAFARVLACNKVLENINLRNSNIADYFDIFISGLRCNTTLRKLNLEYCGLNNRQCMDIYNYLKNQTSMIELCMRLGLGQIPCFDDQIFNRIDMLIERNKRRPKMVKYLRYLDLEDQEGQEDRPVGIVFTKQETDMFIGFILVSGLSYELNRLIASYILE